MLARRTFLACLAALPALAPARAAEPVTVFAAASLKTALDAVIARWRGDGGGDVTVSYAASSALAKQIEQGAPADLFISADRDWMAYLADRNLLAGDGPVDLLGNRLVLIAAANSSLQVRIEKGFPLDVLLGEGRLAVADVKAVPAGKYARAALEWLGVWDKVEARLAQAENVRAALKLVALGEAPLGIVYATDAKAEPAVRVLDTFPAQSHPAIIYPASLVGAAGKPGAQALLAFLQSPAALAVFTAQGFTARVAPTNN